MNRSQFINLLEMYVNESWENHDTYNSFIRGFGNSFDDFSEQHMVKFVTLLGKAGLNQQDILEAVIEKVNSSADRRSTAPMTRNMILDLIATGIKFDALKSDAFTEFI